MTLVGCLRLMGGGTLGAWVSTATSSPLTEGSVIFVRGSLVASAPKAPAHDQEEPLQILRESWMQDLSYRDKIAVIEQIDSPWIVHR